MSTPILYGYYRSSAAYRIRIALAWKNIACDSRPIQLRDGEQMSAGYLAVNPQGLVPALAIDGHLLAQSQAILDYLEETRPQPPLLPDSPAERAQVRRLAQMVIADIHPLNNSRVIHYLAGPLQQSAEAVSSWIRHWITLGFVALEQLVDSGNGGYCHGGRVSLADLCLVPQLYNARRFGVDLTEFPRLLAIDRQCCALPAFQTAHPDRQSDAPLV
jgi:maleylacetoacetate isomerase